MPRDSTTRKSRTTAPRVGSPATLHIIQITTTEDIPDALTLYERLIERGEMHPGARAMWAIGADRRGALSPLQPPTLVRDVVTHAVR